MIMYSLNIHSVITHHSSLKTLVVMACIAIYLTHNCWISLPNWGQFVLTYRIRLPVPPLCSSLVPNPLSALFPQWLVMFHVQICIVFKFQFFRLYVPNSTKSQAYENMINECMVPEFCCLGQEILDPLVLLYPLCFNWHYLYRIIHFTFVF